MYKCGAVRRDDGCGPRCGVDDAEWAMRWGRDGKRRRLLWPCGLAVLMERESYGWVSGGGGDAAAEMGSGSLAYGGHARRAGMDDVVTAGWMTGWSGGWRAEGEAARAA